MSVAGTVESFDAANFKANLAASVSVTPAAVTLTVTAAAEPLAVRRHFQEVLEEKVQGLCEAAELQGDLRLVRAAAAVGATVAIAARSQLPRPQ
jgi:hypothetical protein